MLLLTYTAVTVFLIWLTTYFYGKKEEAHNLTHELSRVQLDVLGSVQAQNDFLLHETINPEFFRTQHSGYIASGDSLNEVVSIELKRLGEHSIIVSLELSHRIDELKDLEKAYRHLFSKLVDVIRIRGFQNYGLEGEMRTYAHKLESDYQHTVRSEDLLLLRRHEKDFIIRRDEQYVDKFSSQMQILKESVANNDLLQQQDAEQVLNLLDQYQSAFIQLVAAEKSIGLNASHGLKREVDNLSRLYIKQLDLLVADIHSAQARMISQLEVYFLLSLIFFITVSIVASIVLARNMTSRLAVLKENLSRFVSSNFKETSSYPDKVGKDEVGELTKNFKVLEDEIVVHFNHYRNKVEKRTQEILNQKEEIEITKGIIERKNKDMLDSIKYAKRIQDSILPEDRFIAQLLPEHFIFFQPKDIVSGDFYWVDHKDNLIYLAVADCTGHGVPGAFMSIIGYNLLNQAIHEKGLSSPELILNYLNIGISTTLGQDDAERQKKAGIKDGMDIALVVMDLKAGKLQFSGAQRPLVIIRNQELMEFKGNRMPVGGYLFGQYLRFDLHEIDIQSGDRLYLFSDGFSDQFGGEHQKKFKYAKKRELLYSLRETPFNEHCQILRESFEIWKGKQEQIDDICIFGMQVQ